MARLRDIQGISENRQSFIVDFSERLIRFRLKDGSLIDPFDYTAEELIQMGREEKLYNIRTDYGEIESLIDYIKANGVPSHLKFYRDTQDGKEVLVSVDGHRRTISTVALKEQGIEIKSAKFDLDDSKSDAERIFVMLASSAGKPLTILERAEGVKQLRNYGWSDTEISKRLPNEKGTVGVSIASVGQLATLASATEETKEHIQNGFVSASTVIQTIKDSPTVEKASEVISKAVEDAKAKGKTKATVKNIEAVKTATKTDEELETEKQDEIQYLSEFDWRDLSDSDRKKIMKILVK